jgi:hypothetical protein
MAISVYCHVNKILNHLLFNNFSRTSRSLAVT